MPGVGDVSFPHCSRIRGSSRDGMGKTPFTCNFVTAVPSPGIRREYGRLFVTGTR